MTGDLLEALVQRIDMADEEVKVLNDPDIGPAVVILPKFLWDMILDTRRLVP